MFYKARNEAIKFYDGYSLMMFEAKTKENKIKLKEQDIKY